MGQSCHAGGPPAPEPPPPAILEARERGGDQRGRDHELSLLHRDVFFVDVVD